nr:hypothetical protein [Roseobacter sp. H9]
MSELVKGLLNQGFGGRLRGVIRAAISCLNSEASSPDRITGKDSGFAPKQAMEGWLTDVQRVTNH